MIPQPLLTAYILDHALDQLCDYLDVLKDKLVPEDPPSSQYLLVQRIPNNIFFGAYRTPGSSKRGCGLYLRNTSYMSPNRLKTFRYRQNTVFHYDL